MKRVLIVPLGSDIRVSPRRGRAAAARIKETKEKPAPLWRRGLSGVFRRGRASGKRPVAPPSSGDRLVVVLAAVPLLDELVEEVRVGLGLGVGLVHGVDLGHEGVALGGRLVLSLEES